MTKVCSFSLYSFPLRLNSMSCFSSRCLITCTAACLGRFFTTASKNDSQRQEQMHATFNIIFYISVSESFCRFSHPKSFSSDVFFAGGVQQDRVSVVICEQPAWGVYQPAVCELRAPCFISSGQFETSGALGQLLCALEPSHEATGEQGCRGWWLMAAYYWRWKICVTEFW